jgi:hypothetical protein
MALSLQHSSWWVVPALWILDPTFILAMAIKTTYFKEAIFWVVIPCGSNKNKSFRGMYRLIVMVERIIELGTMLALTSK